MGRRTRRVFTGHRELLSSIGECRRACVLASGTAPIGEPIYKRTGELMDAIDNLAEALTGDRTHFHMKMEPLPCAQPAAMPGGRKNEA